MNRLGALAFASAGMFGCCFGATDLRELTFQVAVPAEKPPVIDGSHEAEDKKINDQCLTNIVRLINEPDFVGEPVAMPLAGGVGKKCAVDFAREAYVYETDAGYVGKVSRVDIAKLEKPFKLYSLFEKEQSAPAFALSTNVVSSGAYVTYDLAGLRPNSIYRLTVKEPVDAAKRPVDAESLPRQNEEGRLIGRGKDSASTGGADVGRGKDSASTGGADVGRGKDSASTGGCEISNREEVFCFDGAEKKRTFQFPYSDRPGVYVATLRDIATGLETSVPVRVK